MMKITLTENKLRSIIREAIIKHLNENIDNNGISVSNEELEKRLRNGEDPEDIFDCVDKFYNGYAKVKINDKWNFIDRRGNIANKQWLDDISDFYEEEYAEVKLNNKYNFIDKYGKILSKQWFDDVDMNYNDYLILAIKYGEGEDKYKFFSKQEKKFLVNYWLDWIDIFENDYSVYTKVRKNNKYNFIDEKGKYLSKQWFDNVGYFDDGYAKVKLNGKINIINTQGHILSKQWFDDIGYFGTKYALVLLNNKYNLIDKRGKLLLSQWADEICSVPEGNYMAGLKINNEWIKITSDGKIEDFVD